MSRFATGMHDEENAIRRPSVSSFDPEGAASRHPKRPRKGNGVRKAKDGAAGHEEASNASETAKSALSRIVELSTYRDRSTVELRQRLTSEGYAASDVERDLERALECRIVDDARFADAFVRGRISAGKGERAIRRDLAKHGIDLDSVEGWPEQFGMGFDEQCERAYRDICGRSLAHSKDVYATARRRLESKGYPTAVAHAAAMRFKSEADSA